MSPPGTYGFRLNPQYLRGHTMLNRSLVLVATFADSSTSGALCVWAGIASLVFSVPSLVLFSTVATWGF